MSLAVNLLSAHEIIFSFFARYILPFCNLLSGQKNLGAKYEGTDDLARSCSKYTPWTSRQISVQPIVSVPIVAVVAIGNRGATIVIKPTSA